MMAWTRTAWQPTKGRYGTIAGLEVDRTGGRTPYDKLSDEHGVHTQDDGTAMLYIDRHLVHEVTSPAMKPSSGRAKTRVDCCRSASYSQLASHRRPRCPKLTPTPAS
jgi:hypothetical protein